MCHRVSPKAAWRARRFTATRILNDTATRVYEREYRYRSTLRADWDRINRSNLPPCERSFEPGLLLPTQTLFDEADVQKCGMVALVNSMGLSGSRGLLCRNPLKSGPLGQYRTTRTTSPRRRSPGVLLCANRVLSTPLPIYVTT